MTLLEVITKLAPEIERSDLVHAMWIEGSYATGKHTDKSDIDIWLDVDDGTFEKCVVFYKEQLNSIQPIEKIESRGVYSQNPKLMKVTFFLENYPDEQYIELDLQEHSRKFEFTPGENEVKVLFDKDNTIKWKKP